mgnify:CR=1 FL=1
MGSADSVQVTGSYITSLSFGFLVQELSSQNTTENHSSDRNLHLSDEETKTQDRSDGCDMNIWFPKYEGRKAK